MRLKNRFFRLMAEADAGDQGGAGGAAAADPVDAGAAAAAATGDAGTQGAAAAAAGKGDAAGGNDWLPEKYRTNKEDGTLDIEASSKKLAEAHAHLEKKLGSGDVPPAAPTDYTITPPEQFKDVFTREDPILDQFLKDAHASGFTQKQVDLALSRYFEVIPQIANASKGMTQEQAAAALRESWQSEEEFDGNVKGAFKAFMAYADPADRDKMDEVGNNPIVLRILANIGKEMKEDKPAGGDSAPGGGDDIEALQRSEAYLNPKHQDHAKVSERVRRHFEKKYGNDAAI